MLWNLDIPRVPVLYSGPFSKAVMIEHTEGKTVAGSEVHMREGIVVTPRMERRTDRGERVIVKSVSEAYLLRRGDVTEYA